jgi:uncharacterized membrane protein YjdF
MSLGTVFGYFVLLCGTLYSIDYLLSLNPLKWILAIAAVPFNLALGSAILVFSGSPPTSQQIAWYIEATAVLAVLVFISRLYQWFQLATGRKTIVKATLLDKNGNTTGYIQ